MSDIKSAKLLYIKGGLFVVVGLLASAAILFDHPSLRTAGLLLLAIWAFARAYYFAFYVIEHYIDGDFRYAGLASFVRHALSRKRKTTGD